MLTKEQIKELEETIAWAQYDLDHGNVYRVGKWENLYIQDVARLLFEYKGLVRNNQELTEKLQDLLLR